MFPYLAEDLRWNLVGAPPVVGRAAVVAACEHSTAGLAGVTTTFDRFKVVADEGPATAPTPSDSSERPVAEPMPPAGGR